MTLDVMHRAKRVAAVVPGAAVSGVGEGNVAAFVVADQTATALRRLQSLLLAAQAAALTVLPVPGRLVARVR